MRLAKLLKINKAVEERKIPCDMEEPFTYTSKSTEGKLDIMDMDIVHFIRAFEILSGKKELNTSTATLNIISEKLCIASVELKEYLNNG